MSRTGRIYSESGYYHVISRGTNKQVIFHRDIDNYTYLKYLKKYSIKYKIEIIAYCLMKNHIHILLHDENQNISKLIHDVHTSYSVYHNCAYNKTGHVFECRFKAQAIEKESYLLNAFRYILQNPKKAGICNIEEYKWSSYNTYNNNRSQISLDVIKTYLPTFSVYKEFLASPEIDYYFEFDKISKDEEWAKFLIKKNFDVKNCTELKNFDEVTKVNAIKKLKEKGLSINLISNLTGISRWTVSTAK